MLIVLKVWRTEDWITVSKEVTPAHSWSSLQYYPVYNVRMFPPLCVYADGNGAQMLMSAWAMFLLGRSPAGPIRLSVSA